MYIYIHIYIYIYIYIYIIFYILIMSAPGYHRNGFMATRALGNMMYCSTMLVPMNQRVLKKLGKERKISVHK